MTALLDQPEILGPVVAMGRSRAIAAGVDPCEYDTIATSLSTASEWPAALGTAGSAHLARARHAEAAHHQVTAADAYLAAAACCHIATTLPTPDLDGHAEAAEAMTRALAILEPACTR